MSRLCAAAILVSAAACRESVVAVAARPERHLESEPDDSSSRASWCGLLAPGSRRILEGHVTSGGPDLLDGFAFTAAAPCSVRFRLVPSLPGADLDLGVCDPALDAFTRVFDGTDIVEAGRVALPRAGMDVDLVVCSAWASTGYTLEIEAMPLVPDAAAPSPADRKGTLAKLAAYLRRNEPAGLASAAAGRVDVGAGVLAAGGSPLDALAIGAVANLATEFVSGFAGAPE